MLTELILFSGGLYVLSVLGKFYLIKYPVGMRKPGTEEGSWTGAYVGCAETIYTPCVSGFFKDGLDYIGEHSTWFPVLFHIYSCWRKGWKPMTKEDINKTAGI